MSKLTLTESVHAICMKALVGLEAPFGTQLLRPSFDWNTRRGRKANHLHSTVVWSDIDPLVHGSPLDERITSPQSPFLAGVQMQLDHTLDDDHGIYGHCAMHRARLVGCQVDNRHGCAVCWTDCTLPEAVLAIMIVLTDIRLG